MPVEETFEELLKKIGSGAKPGSPEIQKWEDLLQLKLDETDWSTYNEPVIEKSDEDLLRLINGGADVGSNTYRQAKWEWKIKKVQEKASSHIHRKNITQLLHLLLEAYKQSPDYPFVNRTNLLNKLQISERDFDSICREAIESRLIERSKRMSGHFVTSVKITTNGIDYIKGIPDDDVEYLLLTLQHLHRDQPTNPYIFKSELITRLGWTEQRLNVIGSYAMDKGYVEQLQRLGEFISGLKITSTGIECLSQLAFSKGEQTEDIISRKDSTVIYDVALSFAGEDRRYAKELADILTADGYKVFYDEHKQASLWGKDLYVYFSDVYKNKARYCVMFLSDKYANKLWTNHERRSAQARAFKENNEYILPIRLDNTEISGILETTGYLDLRQIDIREIYQILKEKLGPPRSQ